MVVTGASTVAAIIDPMGRLVQLDVDKDGSEVILLGDVRLGSGTGTTYTLLGDILGWVLLLALVGFTAYQVIENRRGRSDPPA